MQILIYQLISFPSGSKKASAPAVSLGLPTTALSGHPGSLDGRRLSVHVLPL